MTEEKPKTLVEAGAAAYDELLNNDWKLRMELEAKDRLYKAKDTAKKVKKAKEEEKKKKLKKLLKIRARRRFRWF